MVPRGLFCVCGGAGEDHCTFKLDAPPGFKITNRRISGLRPSGSAPLKQQRKTENSCGDGNGIVDDPSLLISLPNADKHLQI